MAQDEWGHGRRYDLYLDAAHNSDRFLAELWRTVQSMPEYKGNRRKTRKPITYKPLRDWCHDVYETFQRPTLEGDDVLVEVS